MKLFVSYAREDRETVDRLTSELTSLGHDVWFDAHLLGGAEWWAAILDQVRGADVVVFALSPDSIASSPCLTELSYAGQLNRRVLPVMIRATPIAALPPELAYAQYVEYSKGSWQDLSRALVHMPASAPLPDPLPPPPPVPLAPLAELRRTAESNLPMSPSDQTKLLDGLLREGSRGGAAAIAYDTLMALEARHDVAPEQHARRRAVADKLWSRMNRMEKGRRVGPGIDDPSWQPWFYLLMLVACCVSFGIVAIVVGWRNREGPNRTPALVLLVLGVAWALFFVVSGVIDLVQKVFG